MGFNFFEKKEERVFLVLDVGTEAVKVLLVKKEKDKNLVLAGSIQYFEKFGVFDGQDFNKEIIKQSILKATQELLSNYSVNLKKIPVVLGLAPNVLRARVICQLFGREKPEKKISKEEQEFIYQQVLEAAKKEISQDFANGFGILASEIEWINLKILAIKIDGYFVSEISGYEGGNLDFKILATFLPRYYSENIKNLFNALKSKVSQIVHIAENLSPIFRTKERDGFFIDIGGEISQIFLVKKGELEEIFDFPIGGKAFSQALAETLGLSEDSARVLKEQYSNKLLNIETEKRVREILSSEKINWQQQLTPEALSLPIFIFGGGSLTPEIQEVLSYNNKEVKIVCPKDIEGIEDLTEKLNSPQYVPALLLIKQKHGEKNF